MNLFGGDEAGGARLDFGNPVLNLAIPGSLSIEISVLLQRLQELFCKASSILGRQGLGSG
jgi:hypothetical protein